MNRKKRRQTTLRSKEPEKRWSEQARKTAEAVLEVLAGAMTPQEAAKALEMSFSRYYILEAKAVEGLISACEPGRKGRALSSDRELERLRQSKEYLARQVARYQALVRASHKTVGLSTVTPEEKKGKRKKHRPTVRALKFSRSLKETGGEQPANPEAAQADQQSA